MSFENKEQTSDYLKEIVKILNESRPEKIESCITPIRAIPQTWAFSDCKSLSSVTNQAFELEKPPLIFELPDQLVPRTIREIIIDGDNLFRQNAKFVMFVDDMRIIDSSHVFDYLRFRGEFKFTPTGGLTIKPHQIITFYYWTDAATQISVDIVIHYEE